MKDLKIILENVDDICEKFEMEGLHTHPTYKQFKRLFTALNKIAEPVQLVSYATDMVTCTLTNGDGIGYFYNRVDPDQPAGYTAVDVANAAADWFRDGAASKSEPCDGCFMAEAEALRKDAERYRFIREDLRRGGSNICMVKKVWNYPEFDSLVVEDDADREIDAAIVDFERRQRMISNERF